MFLCPKLMNTYLDKHLFSLKRPFLNLNKSWPPSWGVVVHQFWAWCLTRAITGRSFHVQHGYHTTSKWRPRIRGCTVVDELPDVAGRQLVVCQSGSFHEGTGHHCPGGVSHLSPTRIH
ncbi:hypothetical protein CEXT_508901 [Caerostris extrusa]|uniref:Uncharacterized protein n=1 Tax=Caerostris extrusa TaxID=172846 RepID=A0AAV4MAY8_CAEEX|nr:hypothetical protein CEXT_508901 [Caerostris extrusa]